MAANHEGIQLHITFLLRYLTQLSPECKFHDIRLVINKEAIVVVLIVMPYY